MSDLSPSEPLALEAGEATGGHTATVLTPTWLEYCAVVSLRPSARIVHAGIRLSCWSSETAEQTIVVCGLAGALRSDLMPGTVVVPELVGEPDGSMLRCDPELVDTFRSAARSMGLPVEGGKLLTAPGVVTGNARQEWAGQGFIAADMETGLLAGRASRMATVRVILDTPERSISPQWERPMQAIWRPRLGAELLWLAWAGPRYAFRAARVLRAGLAAPGSRL